MWEVVGWGFGTRGVWSRCDEREGCETSCRLGVFLSYYEGFFSISAGDDLAVPFASGL